MPSAVRGTEAGQRPDFILGDRYGTSCVVGLIDAAAEILTGLGYRVSRNKPYAGGFITEHYGRPLKGLHALQIEINRGLYMDEGTTLRGPGFEDLQRDLARFVDALVAIPDQDFYPDALAAE
jgi:N-formylglutamate amidohydrolase